MTTGTITNRQLTKDEEGEGYVQSWEQGGVRFEVIDFVKTKKDGKTIGWKSATYQLRLATARANAKGLTFVWEKGALRFDGTRYSSFTAAAEAASTYLARGTARGTGGEGASQPTRRTRRNSVLSVVPVADQGPAPEVDATLRPRGNHQAEDTANLAAQHQANRDLPPRATHDPVANDTPLSELSKLELKGIAGTAGLETRGTKDVLLATLAAAGMTTWGDTLAGTRA